MYMSHSNNFWNLSKQIIDEFGGVHSSSLDSISSDSGFKKYGHFYYNVRYNISDGYHKIKFMTGGLLMDCLVEKEL